MRFLNRIFTVPVLSGTLGLPLSEWFQDWKTYIFKVLVVYHVLKDRQMRTITKFSVEG